MIVHGAQQNPMLRPHTCADENEKIAVQCCAPCRF